MTSGYRCPCWVGAYTDTDERLYNDAIIYLEQAAAVEPGSSAIVRLQPVLPDVWPAVTAGSVLDVCEGSRVVGSATVIELLPSQ